MAHYAKLDDNNQVINVVVVDNDKELKDGVEDEATGIAYLTGIHGYTNWKKTSYNTLYNEHALGGTPFRGNYACISGHYYPEHDIFMEVKPYDSWTLNTSNAKWTPPVDYPTVLKSDPDSDDLSTQYGYNWDENNQRWICTDDDTVTGNVTHIWNPSTSAWDNA